MDHTAAVGRGGCPGLDNDENLIRRDRALRYSAKVALRRARAGRRIDSLVGRLLAASALLLLWAVTLALLVG